MKFELTGRIVFEADDTEDAFKRLAAHFTALAKEEESELPLVGTNVKIQEIEPQTAPTIPPHTKRVTYRGQRKT